MKAKWYLTALLVLNILSIQAQPEHIIKSNADTREFFEKTQSLISTYKKQIFQLQSIVDKQNNEINRLQLNLAQQSGKTKIKRDTIFFLKDKNRADSLQNAAKTLLVQLDSLAVQHTLSVKANKELTDTRDKIEKSYRFLVSLFVITLAASVFYAIWAIFIRRKRLTEEEKVELTGAKNMYYKDIISQFIFYRQSANIIKNILFFGLLITGLIIVFIILFIVNNWGVDLHILIEDKFWTVCGTIAIPLLFISTIYNFVEGKRSECAKVLAEFKSKG